MSKASEARQSARALSNRAHTQARILETYGRDLVVQKQRELCDNCQFHGNCGLLPVLSNGSDCIYFRQKVVEPET